MNAERHHRAVITGLGLVTGLGSGADGTWSAMREGCSAIRSFDEGGLRILGAPAVMPAGASSVSPEQNISLAVLAAREAVRGSGLDLAGLAGPRSACTVSSSKGGMKSLFAFHEDFLKSGRVPAEFWQRVMMTSPGAAVAREFGITGAVVNYAAACATGVHSVIAGAAIIERGEADAVLAGATDASLTLPLVVAFDRMGVLSHCEDSPQTACRPFDRSRDGFCIGEGAAVMVLESERHARERGADILAYIAGTAWGADAYDLARVSGKRSVIAPLMAQALARAGFGTGDVGYVNAHGTGTQANDPIEAGAIREALGGDAMSVPVSSFKPAIGHLLGAAGGVELALTVLALRDGFIPPTLNLCDPDPRCRLNHVMGTGIEKDINVAVKIAAGFGGHIGIVVLEKARA